ncbi:MAG: lysophospholipid acyltransferase family protein, partial [Candidatus Cloacimonetes bacterium]|nr:lysophospholipid acyltransferase family protein [Candidatus Cloacimonadota bacterium]
MKKKTKNKIEFTAFLIFIKIFKSLPYAFVEKFLSNLFMTCGKIFKIRYDVAYENLKKVFPAKTDKELNNIIKEMYGGMGKTAAETYFGNNDKLLKKAEIQGFENLEKALKQGRGVILATLHMGNWELAAIFLSRYTKTSAVLKKQRNRYFDEYMNKQREQENIELIDKKNALRPIIKNLKENNVVCILMDQNAGKNGIKTDFLGHPASTFVGTAKIAIKQKCPIIPAVAYRDESGKNIFILEQPIITDNIENSPLAVKTLTELVSKRLEKYILQNPSQWFWVHKRWKGTQKAKEI